LSLTKLYAFLWKDWEEARSYRLAHIMQFAGLALPLLLLFFMGQMFDQVHIESIDQYGGNYVAFALMGIIVTTYSGNALRAFSTTLRRAQVVGTLEVLFLTRANLPTLLFGWSLYPFLRSTLSMVVFLVAGFLVLGLSFDNVNVLGAVLTVALLVVVMGSLGVMAASFTLMFKQGDPFTSLLVVASGLLSGTIYPVQVLPEWLQTLAKTLPHTYAIETVRLAVLRGSPLEQILPGLAVLAIYAAVLVPLGFLAFNYALRRAKQNGSLAHY
jgi:ABC-2 type transport system permease protein